MRNYYFMLAAVGGFLGLAGVSPLDLSARHGPDAPSRVATDAVLPFSTRLATPWIADAGLVSSRIEQAVARLDPHITLRSHPEALRYAVRAYHNFRAAHPEEVRKPYLYFVDYGLDSATPRGYVLNMVDLSVVDGPFMVAHGRGSVQTGENLPTRFLNVQDSNATSLGLYLAEEMYRFQGKSGGRVYTSPGLRLRGVSGRFNDAARERGIVVHGAPYVTSAVAGRSEGCPAVEPGLAEELIPRIADGGLVFHFSPLDRRWLREDPWSGVVTPSLAGLY